MEALALAEASTREARANFDERCAEQARAHLQQLSTQRREAEVALQAALHAALQEARQAADEAASRARAQSQAQALAQAEADELRVSRADEEG